MGHSLVFVYNNIITYGFADCQAFFFFLKCGFLFFGDFCPFVFLQGNNNSQSSSGERGEL